MAKNRRKSKFTGLCKPWKLSGELKDVVGVSIGSRIQITKLLWRYLRDNNLKDPMDLRFFFPDKKMSKVFGTGRRRCFAMAKFLNPHLQNLA